MKKILKKAAVVLIVLILLLALFVASWAFFLGPRLVATGDGTTDIASEFIQLAEESEKIDFNELNGVLYVNNEIIVFIKASVTEEQVSALFASYNAQVDDSMSDIDVYRLILNEAMTYSDLESLVGKIKADPIVEDAYVNAVSGFEADTADSEDDFAYKDPAYPDDPWSNDSWDVSVPRGENWGMEAIDAPGAWGYADQFSTVKIGLIDSMPDTSHEDLSFANCSCLFIDEKTGLTSINKYTMSADNHGTHVAGTMNARWNNGAGISGDGVSGVMAGKGELYYSAVYYDFNGSITTKYATAYSYLLALKTLIDQDVQVINISQNTSRLIGFAASHGNQNAINYLSLQADLAERGLSRIITAREVAGKPDFVICVAAGNSNHTYYYKDDTTTYGYREEMTSEEYSRYLSGWRGEIGGSLAQYNNFLNLMDAEEVKNRVIVVGAVGIDAAASTPNSTQYSYAYFSNVGSRVDVVAPGIDVYSCIPNGYDSYAGTSMATPHVSGVAGLIFACNPSLSGPDVKNILVTSSTGRYYHGDKYSGLLNANNAVVNALKTVKTPVEKVLRKEVDNGLDLCFVVDTTASMGDDIADAKSNMASILEHLAAKTENYRVALIDYRDYPERSDEPDDYPCRVQLGFSSDNTRITDAINGLDLGDGGDIKETVYSALMEAVGLDWRSDAKKVIIILGDAAPLDPEPNTAYTYDDVLLALFNADISIDYEDSDERVVSSLDDCLINVFSIGTDASADAEDFFRDIASGTGGSYASVDDASEVGDAIISSIEQIEVTEKITVHADFGDAMANQKINLYSGNDYLFTLETDANGQLVIDSIEADTYKWTSNSLYSGGSINVDSDSRNATVRINNEYWFTPLLQTWYQHTALICLAFAAFLALCIAAPVSMKNMRVRVRKKKVPVPVVPRPAPVVRQTQVPNNIPVAVKPVPPVAVKPVSDESGLQCPKCGLKAVSGARFCKRCGCDLQKAAPKTTEHVCGNCGRPYKEDETFCATCGTKIEKE